MTTMWRYELTVDPASIGTAQQKRFDSRTRRFFTHKKVSAGMKVITMLSRSMQKAQEAIIPAHGEPISLGIEFYYAVPKSRAKARKGVQPPAEGEACTAAWAGDCDNRAKAVIDALTEAGFWPDDRFVTTLNISKHWTYRISF